MNEIDNSRRTPESIKEQERANPNSLPAEPKPGNKAPDDQSGAPEIDNAAPKDDPAESLARKFDREAPQELRK